MTSSSLPNRADVVVIGGGAIGAAAAWHLSREPKLSVAVLEARAVGAGSTSRSAAAFRQQFSSHSHVQMSLYSRQEYERFPETFGGDPVFLQQGYLFLYTDPEAAEAARARVAWQQTAGVGDAAYLGPREVDALPGLEGVFAVDALAGATWCPTDGFLRPTEIASGYVEGARRRGVSVHVGARVTGFETKGGAVQAVKVGAHRIETRAVVLAAGWWSHHVADLADCPIPVTAVKRYLYVTPQFARRRVEHFPLVVWNLGAYARPEANGLMMGWDERPEKPPGTERHPGPLQDATSLEADQDEIEPGYGKGIDDYGMEVLAQLAEAMPWLADEGRIAHVACGYYEVTPDDRAIIAQDPRLRGLFHASGFSGHGIMHAPAAGLAVAELALGKDPTFPMEPFALAPLLEDRPRAEPERMVI